jgi:ribose transport system substrate-binding protein
MKEERMKKKCLGLFLLAFTTLVFFVGCKKQEQTSQEDAGTEIEEEEKRDGYLFGYSGIDMENPYFQTLEEAIELYASKEKVSIVTKDPAGDVEKQKEQIQEFIDEKVDAVFLAPVDMEAITPALEALNEAGIPIVNVDTQVKEIDLVDAFVGSDNKDAGYLCGMDLREQRPDGGSVVILESPTMNAINERITGFEKAIANEGFQVLSRVNIEGKKENAKQATLEFIETHKQLDAIMCGSDWIAQGVVEALKQAGRTDVLVYSVDASPQIKQWLQDASTQMMRATSAQSPINIAKKAMDIAIAILNGEEYSKQVTEKVYLINRDNVSLYGIDGWQ